MDRKISRRRFVEQAGLGAATLAGASAIGTVELQAQQNAAGAVPTTWDFHGQVIPGLYCGGESAGGCSQHGQGRAITQGYIAGKEAAGEKSWT